MEIGHHFERRLVLSRDDIARFATEIGDTNPMHHDENYATATRFGGLIASGAHPVALLVALCGAQAKEGFPGVGLEFNFRLIAAVKPDTELLLRWEVVAVEPKPKLKGRILSLRGTALDGEGRQLVAADAKILMSDAL